MASIKPGKLDRRISIERPLSTADSYGRPVVTGWTSVAQVWAARRDLSGRELVLAGAERADFGVSYTIRDPGCALDARMRVVEDGQAFGITAIQRLKERGAGFEIVCRNVDAVGVQT